MIWNVLAFSVALLLAERMTYAMGRILDDEDYAFLDALP